MLVCRRQIFKVSINEREENNMNRQKIDKRYMEGGIFINPDYIKRASGEGKLELVARENNRATLGSEYNIYIGIKGTRYVLMHIKRNQYTVINKRVWCLKNGKWIQLAKRLANRFHFKIGNGEITTRPRKKQRSNKKTLYLYRVIMSFSLYGDIDKLDTNTDVHHVMDRYFNMISCLRYINHSEHLSYHFENGNDSRREGRIIESYEEFCDFLEEIKRVDRMASIMEM